MGEQRVEDDIVAGIGGGGDRRNPAGYGEFDVGAAFDEPLRDRYMAAFGRKIERGGAGEIACIDRRPARQQKINHLEMAGSCGTTERPGTKPVTGVERCALVK